MPVTFTLLCETFNYCTYFFTRDNYGVLQDDTPNSYFQFSTDGRDNQSIKKLTKGGSLNEA